MPKVHGAHEVVNQVLKPETHPRREGTPKPIPVILKKDLEKDRKEQVLEGR